MNVDEEFCRVCRCEGTPESPLYHPCKCSGSIRYVHQECLVEWLKHSRKKYCELCYTPFSFTKVYADSMPRTLPFKVLCIQMWKSFLSFAQILFRGLVAWFFYGFALEYCSRFAFVLSLQIGDYLAHNKPSTMPRMTEPLFPVLPDFVYKVVPFPGLMTRVVDGFFIALFTVSVFVTFALIREWVLQNAIQVADEMQDQRAEMQDQQAPGAPNAADIRNARAHVAFIIEQMQNEQRRLQERRQQNNQIAQQPDNIPQNAGDANGLLGELVHAIAQEARDQEQQDGAHDAVHPEEPQAQHLDPEVEEENVHQPAREERPIDDVFHLGGEENTDLPRRDVHLDSAEERNHEAVANHDVETTSSDDSGLDDQQQENRNEPASDTDEQEAVVRNAVDRAAQEDAAIEAVRAQQVAEAEEGEDDFLELLGLRGPIGVIIKNSLSAIIAMQLLLQLFIDFPYIWGRIVIETTFYVLRSPASLITGSFAIVSRLVSFFGSSIYNLIYLVSRVPGVSAVFKKIGIYDFFSTSFSEVVNQLKSKLTSYIVIPGSQLSVMTSFFRTENLEWALKKLKMLPVYRVAHMFLNVCIDFSKNYSVRPIDRLVSIGFGYLMFFGIGMWYLKRKKFIGSHPQVQNFELALREILQQCVSVAKFIIIFAIELVVFPFFCGILICFCLQGVFPNWDLNFLHSSMVSFPYRTGFITWFLGITYMFEFALFVSNIRKVVRPGVLFFLRDPNDPNFHPLRETLEKPLLLQLKKIGFSAILYFAFIIGCVGSVVYVIRLTGLVFPLTYHRGEFIFIAPLDLLAIHALIYTIGKRIGPLKIVESVWTFILSALCRCLRISSYVMGKRYVAEEGHFKNKLFPMLARLRFKSIVGEDVVEEEKLDLSPENFERDGCFVRCPSFDAVPVKKNAMLIFVTEDGHELQGEKKKLEESNEFMLAYAPPKFYARLWGLLLCSWLIAAIANIFIVIVPMLVGRRLYAYMLPKAVDNDIYAYTIGIVSLGFIAYTIYLLRTYREKFTLHSVTSFIRQYGLVQLVKTTAWACYMVSVSLFVVPLLVAVALDLYFVIPIRTLIVCFESNSALKINNLTVDLNMDYYVALCVLFSFGFIRFSLEQGLNNLNDALSQLWRRGGLGLKTIAFLFAFIVFPFAFGVATLPLVDNVFQMISKHIPIPEFVTFSYQTLYCRACYPLLFNAILFSFLFTRAKRLFSSWTVEVRDDLYMVGTKLHNYDDAGASRAEQ
ncbi:ER-localized ubiquitin ligase Doa10 [Schizosaccharomyces japonicus yFS275]|uniref:RING-type E3 ubiquitin transferase n=1 Tax=Schizosaccharomyces japonicus (strain yFS275 / FY16936) TaxID=402676 RepID=B6K4U4_SCHJY|nr:ER-localized ubiquitin ligase Doa10 [Schizosaccharomyces japonicus yFS275]EEB08501.1 ER-localized ubiquitin ligase Doa10 [Schizosaccharomyces japonicus yFS275]